MRITHVITGLNDGGAEAVLYRLCTNDQAQQHTVISLMDAGKYGPLLVQAGVNLHCLGMRRGRMNLPGVIRLWRVMRKSRPDVVQTWMYHADLLGGVAARWAGAKSVVWGIHHSTLEAATSRRSTIWVARTLALLSRWVPRRIAVCGHRAADVHANLGYSREKMRVIQNGYDLARFRPDANLRDASRRQLALPAGVPWLGMVGRYHPQKDHANLVAALQLVHERGVSFHCLLVGAGIEETNEGLCRVIDSAGLSRYFSLLGRRDDMPAFMNAIDLHLLSSNSEAFPNVLAEAMACGTPCVTTDVGDAALIVGETGWVVPPRNPTALADAIHAALGDLARTSWTDRRRVARERIARNFRIEAMVEAYRTLWQEAVAASRR